MKGYSAKIKCFYCGEEFLLEITNLAYIRAYCDSCKKIHRRIEHYASAYKHRRNLTQVYKKAFEKYQKYRDYREKLRKTFTPIVTQGVRNPKRKKPKEAFEPMVRRDDKVFRTDGEKEIYLGTIISENEETVVISKSLLDRGTPIQKKFIKRVA